MTDNLPRTEFTSAEARLSPGLELPITAALATPDKDIAVPNKGQRTSSFAAAVMDLEPEQSTSRVLRVSLAVTVGQLNVVLRDMKENLRNAISPTVANAKKKTDGTYSIELGDVVMTGGSIYVLAVVTRLS